MFSRTIEGVKGEWKLGCNSLLHPTPTRLAGVLRRCYFVIVGLDDLYLFFLSDRKRRGNQYHNGRHRRVSVRVRELRRELHERVRDKHAAVHGEREQNSVGRRPDRHVRGVHVRIS